ncbi:MAG: hypothetical protein ACI9NY_000835 [Kiritimatiellia bacterium]|jgi:hypothetical protein
MLGLFNTLARKRQKNFNVICEAFTKEGVTTVEKAEHCRQSMLSNGKTFVLITTLIGLSLAMLFSSYSLPILVGMGIVLLYLVTSVYRGRELVQLYIDEVLSKPEVLETLNDSEP